LLPDGQTIVLSYKKGSGTRKQVAPSLFKGTMYLGIREYYQKDGDWAPGKTGINLTKDEFKLVLDNLEAIKAFMKV
jgi:hypothetical protein